MLRNKCQIGLALCLILAVAAASPVSAAEGGPGRELWTASLDEKARAFCADTPGEYRRLPEDGYRFLCETLRLSEEWFAARFLRGSYATIAGAIAAIEPARGVKKIFYPFGGPDLATPFAVFPEAEEVVAVALEDPGDTAAPFLDLEGRKMLFPYPNDIAEKAEASPLSRLFMSLTNYHGFGYSTVEHIREAALAPAVIVQAMRDLKGTILSLQRFSLAGDGRMEMLDATGGSRHAVGIQLTFTLPDPPRPPRTCIYRYIRWNLDDEHFSPDGPLGRAIAGFGFEGVLLKAASELPASSKFSNVRKAILDRARLIVDDGELDPIGAELSARFTTHLVPTGPLTFGYLAAHDGNRVPIRVRREARSERSDRP